MSTPCLFSFFFQYITMQMTILYPLLEEHFLSLQRAMKKLWQKDPLPQLFISSISL